MDRTVDRRPLARREKSSRKIHKSHALSPYVPVEYSVVPVCSRVIACDLVHRTGPQSAEVARHERERLGLAVGRITRVCWVFGNMPSHCGRLLSGLMRGQASGKSRPKNPGQSEKTSQIHQKIPPKKAHIFAKKWGVQKWGDHEGTLQSGPKTSWRRSFGNARPACGNAFGGVKIRASRGTTLWFRHPLPPGSMLGDRPSSTRAQH